jgi:hypothetical protein
MTLKQFLKPDWRKIVIFLAIMFLEFLIFSIYVYSYGQTASIQEICCRESLPALEKEHCVRANVTEEYCIIYREKRATQGFYDLITLFLVLIFDYLLSCLIIWIFDKRKKK